MQIREWHFWAHLCNLHFGPICIAFRLSVCLWLDQNYWTIIHSSKSIASTVLKFGQVMGVADPEVDLEGQGHMSKVKVTRSKTWFLVSIYIFIGQCIKVKVTLVEVKGHLGQGQRSLGSRSAKHSRYCRWAHINVKLHFYLLTPYWYKKLIIERNSW